MRKHNRPKHFPPYCGSYHPPKKHTPDFIHGSFGLAGFGERNFFIGQISRKKAVDTIIKNHYSKRIVNNSYVHLGVFFNRKFVGVLQLGYALVPKGLGKIVANTDSKDYLELNRMWLSDTAPRNSESKAISYAIKFIKKAMPQIRFIQSYADERCGGLGVVYQASGFDYIGSHKTSFYELDGETYHEMLLTTQKKGGNRGSYLRENIHRAIKRTLNQYRYIKFINKGARRYLRVKTLPYPKRGR